MLKLRSLVFLLLALLVVSPVFAQTAEPTTEPGATAAAEGNYTVSVSKNKDFGEILTGEKGMTLYMFTKDTADTSNCYDKCAENWPALTVDSADKISADEEIPGDFGTTTRKDGKLQVTYNGMPLYYWAHDAAAGDTTGNRVGRVWWVVKPATVAYAHDAKLGNILVGPKGMTLYMFTKDTADTSNCYDKCAENWPALTVKSEDDLVAGVNLLGKLATAKRTDGSLQVTYNGMPLYYYKNDKARGDANGDGVGKVWFTVAPETVGVASGKLVSYDGMTVYTFAKDSAGTSTCTGDCAKAWPPFSVAEGDRLAANADVKGKLDTIKRDDGSLQVTYNGLPLYFYKDDKAPGDAKGENVGNVWSTVKP